jgi:hypothetical protein
MNEQEVLELRSKIRQGLLLVSQRLVERSKRQGNELVCADETGRIYRIKGSDIKLNQLYNS